MKYYLIAISILSSLYLAYQIDETNNRLKLVEAHVNIAGQKIQDLDYEVSVLTALQKGEK